MAWERAQRGQTGFELLGRRTRRKSGRDGPGRKFRPAWCCGRGRLLEDGWAGWRITYRGADGLRNSCDCCRARLLVRIVARLLDAISVGWMMPGSRSGQLGRGIAAFAWSGAQVGGFVGQKGVRTQ